MSISSLVGAEDKRYLMEDSLWGANATTAGRTEMMAAIVKVRMIIVDSRVKTWKDWNQDWVVDAMLSMLMLIALFVFIGVNNLYLAVGVFCDCSGMEKNSVHESLDCLSVCPFTIKWTLWYPTPPDHARSSPKRNLLCQVCVRWLAFVVAFSFMSTEEEHFLTYHLLTRNTFNFRVLFYE